MSLKHKLISAEGTETGEFFLEENGVFLMHLNEANKDKASKMDAVLISSGINPEHKPGCPCTPLLEKGILASRIERPTDESITAYFNRLNELANNNPVIDQICGPQNRNDLLNKTKEYAATLVSEREALLRTLDPVLLSALAAFTNAEILGIPSISIASPTQTARSSQFPSFGFATLFQPVNPMDSDSDEEFLASLQSQLQHPNDAFLASLFMSPGTRPADDRNTFRPN